ncbi:MAG: hypothetical protein HND58_13135 [Planctomycetota bacterium]|nr:MAG: hypothetical protein HND58_13135 [Planctomycetota bacterium]
MNRTQVRNSGWWRCVRVCALACCVGGLGAGVLVGGACAGQSGAVASGDALSMARRADLTPGERVQAIKRVKAELASGEMDRVVMRHAMTEMAWALDTPELVRAAALEALLWDEAGKVESLKLVQEMLPTEPGRQCVAVMSTAIADHGWTEATPALVRSLSRPVEGVEDRERAEFRALGVLYPDRAVEEVALGVFLEPRVEAGPAGLQLDMRTREAGWDLVGRLAADGDARARSCELLRRGTTRGGLCSASSGRCTRRSGLCRVVPRRCGGRCGWPRLGMVSLPRGGRRRGRRCRGCRRRAA